MKSAIRSSIIFFETLKSIFRVTWRFIRWLFTNKFTSIFAILSTVIAVSWAIGFFLFVKDIKQTRAEIISDTPEFSSQTDAIVVLTGGSERVKHALFLLSLGYGQKLFVSGVNKEVKLRELLALHGYKPDNQELKSKIELGYSAVDTIQNAEEIAAWVKKNNIKSIRLVTSNYHIKRAMLETQDAIPDVKIIPHGVVPINIRIDRWWDFESTRSLLLSEYNKYILANIRIVMEHITGNKI